MEADRPRLPAPLVEGRLIAIARGVDPDRLVEAVAILADTGIRCVEITLDSPDAARVISRLCERHGDAVAVGAGTAMTIDAAKRAVDAGAGYLVSPHTDIDLIRWAATNGIPAVPGGVTPTEVVTAWQAGAAAVKLFPAGPLGPGYARSLAGPLPHVPLIPTGGIDAGNARAYLDAGAVAVGVGNWLFGDGSPQHVRPRAETLLRALV